MRRITDLFGNHVLLVRVKASTEFLVPLFENLNISTPKKDLYLLANVMSKEEIHEKLDLIATSLNLLEADE